MSEREHQVRQRTTRPAADPALQRAAVTPAAPDAAPPIVHDVLSSPGRPLDAATRAFMEPRFGQDFSGVRVHTGAEAVASAQAVNALAYTVGRDVVFGAGQYTPHSADGRRLLAHELTHVVQQSHHLNSQALDERIPIPIDAERSRWEQEAGTVAQSMLDPALAGATILRFHAPVMLQAQRGGGRRNVSPPRPTRRDFRNRVRLIQQARQNMSRQATRWGSTMNARTVRGRLSIIEIMSRYQAVTGFPGTAGAPETPGQAAGAAIDHMNELAKKLHRLRTFGGVQQQVRPLLLSAYALVTEVNDGAGEVSLMLDIGSLLTGISGDWQLSLPRKQYQLYALVDFDIPVGSGFLVVGIATDEYLLRPFVDRSTLQIQPWKTITGYAPWPLRIVQRSKGQQLVCDDNRNVCYTEPAPEGSEDIEPPKPYPTIGPAKR